jgi:ABC-2 type transport system ATP-binding protein
VDGVSFNVEAGEIFGLLGPNGAGKTTTLECLIGLRDPDDGVVTVCGIDARRHPRELKRRIGAALQTTALQDKITPREAIALFGALYGTGANPDRLLERFDLREKADAAFDTLSGGQRQRLALALAFVNAPEVIVLDEPTAGLDAHARRELHAAIRSFRQDGVAVLLSTHDLDEAQQLCDRVAIMSSGRVAATGAPADLIAGSRALHAVILSTSSPIASALLTSLPDVHDVTCDGATARFRTSNPHRALAALTALLDAHAIAIIELHLQKASLEDLFIELTS